MLLIGYLLFGSIVFQCAGHDESQEKVGFIWHDSLRSRCAYTALYLMLHCRAPFRARISLSIRSKPAIVARRTTSPMKRTKTYSQERELDVETSSILLSAAPNSSGNSDEKGGPKPWTIPFLGLEPSPELFAISMVYFAQGILGLSRLAVTFFYKDTLHLEPAEISFLAGIATFPWLVKPLYGFLSDSFPIMGYRRRSYLLLCGLLGAVSWFGLATTARSAPVAVFFLTMASLSTACSDVVVDSLVGRYSSLCIPAGKKN